MLNNNWRRVFVNDMFELFVSKNMRVVVWVNWGVFVFLVSVLVRVVNRVFVRWWLRWVSVVLWDMERVVVDIIWVDRIGVSGVSE